MISTLSTCAAHVAAAAAPASFDGLDGNAVLAVLGRCHPMVLHLPIGLWIGVAVLEFGSAMRRLPPPRGAIAALAWVAALSGIATAGSGWLLGQEGDFAATRLDAHRWLGVAVGVAGLMAALFTAVTVRGPFRLLLSVTLLLLLPAGHLGADLTHGKDFLLAPLRSPTKAAAAPAGAFAQTEAAAQPGDAGRGQQVPQHVPAAAGTADPADGTAGVSFAGQVEPILARTCTGCHGPDKQKGRLALHEEAAIRKGGKNGAVVVAGRPEDSPLLQRLLLPLDDDDHMPPPDEPQPTEAEIAALRAWIAAGAPFAGDRTGR